ncbi:MaoC family dehydratase, partial [Brevibacterium paucivorans]
MEGLQDNVGKVLGSSGWITVDQQRINAFADATGDHQWIHVDVDRAAAGPFGAPIAHGFLTLSLIPLLSSEAVSVTGMKAKINYGCNK